MVTAGLGPRCDFRPSEWHVGATRVGFVHEGTDYSVPVGGEHHLRDALIAAATADGLGVSPAGVAEGLTGYRPLGNRGALIQVGRLTIVADCYNANPESFAAAIRYCSEAFPGRRLAAVAGSMLELGSAEVHGARRCGGRPAACWFLSRPGGRRVPDRLSIPVSSRGRDRCGTPPSVEGASEELAERLQGDEVLLVKASRGVRLERVIDALTGGEA